MSGKNSWTRRTRRRSEIWEAVFVVVDEEIEFEEGDKDVGVSGEKRVVFGVRESRAVDERENDGLEPGCAGFGSGDEYNIGVLRLEVFLERENALNKPCPVPETLVLMES